MPRFRPWTPIFDVDLKYGDQYSPTSVVGNPPTTGGTITIVGDYIYHTFLVDDTFTPGRALTIDYIVVGGGGSGGGFRSFINENSGGGGGQRRMGSTTVSTPQLITIGAGGIYTGVGNPIVGGAGGDTVFGSIATAPGGEPGGSDGAPRDGGDSGNEITGTTGGTGVAGGTGSGGGAGSNGDGGLSGAGPGTNWQGLGIYYGGGGNGVTNNGNHGVDTEGRNNNPNNPSGIDGWGQGGHQVGNGGSGVVILRYPRSQA